MNTQFLPLTVAADRVIADASMRSRITGSAIATAIAAAMPLPSSPVDDPSNHYLLQVTARVRQIVSEFNENLVFDLRGTLEQTRQLWLVRYTAAHPTARPIYNAQYGFFDSLFGVGTYIAPEQYTFFNTNRDDILFLAAVVSAIMQELNKQN